jgi:hypothetical protein
MSWWHYPALVFLGLLVVGFVYSLVARFMKRADIGGRIEPRRPGQEVVPWRADDGKG